jgi:Holliday junction resolvasome RuvABC DNA-binding subunit
MSKRKVAKFNSVLEDFRRFIGESKEAQEQQGKSESSVGDAASDKEVVDALPGGGKGKGSTTDPLSNLGVDATEKANGTSEPSKEEPSRKECAPSSKVASEDSAASDLVNKLLENIKLATEQLEKSATSHMEDAKEDAKEDAEDEAESAKEDEEEASEDSDSDIKEEKEVKKEEKVASENSIDEDALAEKIASHYRNVSVGYELGKFLFESLGRKVAADEAQEVPMAPEAEAAAPEAAASPEDEIQLILSALQEMVASGEVTEEQAQQVLMELQSAIEGGQSPSGEAAPEQAVEEAPEQAIEEDPKTAGQIFSQDQISEIESNINKKVAEWVSEGKTDKDITELVKQAAMSDADILVQQAEDSSNAQDVNRKIAALVELGYSDEEISSIVKQATEEQEIVEKINQSVLAKVAELEQSGFSEEQIEEYLKQAAQEDAKLLKQQEIKKNILAKVAQERQDKIANIPPEVQQILQALEALLQSGEITEEEATAVLQELGLTGGAEGSPEASPEEAPVEEPAPEQVPQ